MIYADDSLINEYNQPSRDICAEVELTVQMSALVFKRVKINNEKLISLSVKSSLTNTKDLTLGNISTKQLSFKMMFDESLMDKWEKVTRIEASIGIRPKGSDSYIMTKLGEFYIDSFQSNDGFHTMDVTAYDIMTKFDNIDSTWYPLAQLATKDSKYFTTYCISLASMVANRTAVTVDRIASRNAELCEYNSDGTQTETANSYGVSKSRLVFIPAMVNSITLCIHTKAQYTSPLKVCFYDDFYGADKVTSANGYKEYTGYKTETADNGYIITQDITVPGIIKNLFPMYMGFSLLGNDKQGQGDTYDIALNFPDHTQLLNGVNDLNWEELSSHTPREMIMYGLATLGVNLVCPNEPSLYPGVSLGAVDGSTPDNESSYDFSDVRMMPYQETGFEITPDTQYLSEFKTTQYNPLAISYITSGSRQNPVTVRSGEGNFGFNFADTMFTNSDVSEFVMQTILARYSDLKNIMPGSIKYRGNPFVEVGDIIIASTKEGKKYNFIVGENEIRFSGGLSCTVTSNFEITREATKVSTPNTRSITQAINEKESGILNKLAGSMTKLWSGESRMGAGDKISLSEALSAQPRGIILQWQLASSGTASPYGDSNFQFIPKWFSGTCVFDSGGVIFTTNCRKRITVSDTAITGTEYNTQSGTSGNITYSNDRLVLVSVYGF